ncbi:hypothetical protein F5Y15DRAFT_390461 [Xylariaceae sp. FL0016]|nr:hypothetical protein F5Y15DRAFT_390461 [Xylariaceae sp. FL0016]
MYAFKVFGAAAALAATASAQQATCAAELASITQALPTPTNTELASSLAQGQVPTTDAVAGLASLVADFCGPESTLASSLYSDYEVYLTSIVSYVSASSSTIEAYLTICVATDAAGSSSLASVVSKVASISGPYCQSTTAANATSTATGSASGASNSTITATATSTDAVGTTGTTDVASITTGTESSTGTTSSQSALAAKPTGGMMGAAALAMGAFGAVFML